PAAKVSKVAFALDCTQAVAERAVEIGADMLVIHHPLLLRGVESVAADTPKGKVIHTLIRGGVALFAAHTNADSARPESMTSWPSWWASHQVVRLCPKTPRSLISGACMCLPIL